VCQDAIRPAGPNVRALVEYDGSGFLGFQKQPSGRTVQGELEKALRGLTGRPVRVIGAGRTDAGVHATGQVVNFRPGPELPLERLASALDRALPADIAVRSVERADDTFHARYDAKWRTYEYTIRNAPVRRALEWRFVWHVPQLLDVSEMRLAAAALIGTHHFGAFGTPERGRSAVREMLRAEVLADGEIVLIRLTANAFLRHMARGIVGALVEVGLRRTAPDGLARALDSDADHPLFPIAPPQGLCLVEVEY